MTGARRRRRQRRALPSLTCGRSRDTHTHPSLTYPVLQDAVWNRRSHVLPQGLLGRRNIRGHLQDGRGAHRARQTAAPGATHLQADP